MKHTLLFASLFLALTSRAQELPYTFSVFSEPYQHLQDADTANGNEIWDDPGYLIPLGFEMDIMGEVMDDILTIYPGAQILPSIAESELSVLLPYGEDIMDVGNSETGSLSPILYKTEGDPGARIFKMEWQNVGYYDEFANNGTFNNTLSFQMWFYETTHDIEFRYGPNTVKDFSILHPLGGALVGLAKNVNINTGTWEALWLVGGSPLDPTITLFNDIENAPDPSILLSAIPESGTVFHFDTGIVSIEEASDAEAALKLFPSVVQTSLFVATEVYSEYRILDMAGKIIESGRINPGTNELNLETLSSGVYIFDIAVDGNHRTRRFVKV
jgi:hypothetical protein